MTRNNAWTARDPALATKGGTGLDVYVAGDMLYADSGTTLTRLPIGANGTVLTSNGTIPTWGVGSRGSYIHITSITASAQGSVDITNAITSTYRDYLVVVSNFQPVEDDETLQILLSTDNGANYITTAGTYGYYLRRRKFDDGVLLTNFSSSDAAIELTPDGDVKPSEGAGVNLRMYMYDPLNASSRFRATYTGNYLRQQPTGRAVDLRGSCCTNANMAVNAFRLKFAIGNITIGTVAVYGVLNS